MASALSGAVEFGAGQVPNTSPLKDLDDSAVVAAFLAGNKRGFNELVERYQSRLLNFVYRTTGDRERAEDLVQETFIRI
jgi:RNA polymerase sigma-70 factor, ECF subfamily